MGVGGTGVGWGAKVATMVGARGLTIVVLVF